MTASLVSSVPRLTKFGIKIQPNFIKFREFTNYKTAIRLVFPQMKDRWGKDWFSRKDFNIIRAIGELRNHFRRKISFRIKRYRRLFEIRQMKYIYIC